MSPTLIERAQLGLERVAAHNGDFAWFEGKLAWAERPDHLIARLYEEGGPDVELLPAIAMLLRGWRCVWCESLAETPDLRCDACVVALARYHWAVAPRGGEKSHAADPTSPFDASICGGASLSLADRPLQSVPLEQLTGDQLCMRCVRSAILNRRSA